MDDKDDDNHNRVANEDDLIIFLKVSNMVLEVALMMLVMKTPFL